MNKKNLTEKKKQEMAKLLDKNFIKEILDKKLDEFYSDFNNIVEIKEDVYKRHLGITSAVFVVGYEIRYLDKNNNSNYLNIFVSAHSDGSRKGAFNKAKFLYNNGFDRGDFQVTKPLFYLEEQKAFFYEASEGRSLFNFFTQNPNQDLKPVFKIASEWIKKLHNLNKGNYNWFIFKTYNMVPEPERFIVDFMADNKKQGKFIKKLVSDIIKLEEKYIQNFEQVLIYGDYHPENIIIKDLNTNTLKMIDLTDICLGDPMIDLGTFLQQFDFMGHNFIPRKKMNIYKEYFIEAYFQKNIKNIDFKYINRINLYQSWTALRTAVFLFYMKEVENYIFDLLEDSNKYLQLIKDNKKEINIY